VGPLIEVFDRILMDDNGELGYHFVLVDYLCRVVSGTPAAGSDAAAIALADPDALAPYALTLKTQSIIARAMALRKEHEA